SKLGNRGTYTRDARAREHRVARCDGAGTLPAHSSPVKAGSTTTMRSPRADQPDPATRRASVPVRASARPRAGRPTATARSRSCTRIRAAAELVDLAGRPAPETHTADGLGRLARRAGRAVDAAAVGIYMASRPGAPLALAAMFRRKNAAGA